MPTRHEKLAGHAEHLLDAFLRVRSTYALLDPLLFDQPTKQRWGRGKPAHGFNVIVNALLYSCTLDIANIALDRDQRTPSLVQLLEALDDEHLSVELRERFAVWNLLPVGSDDPEVLALLNRSERRDEAKRREEFDQVVSAVPRR